MTRGVVTGALRPNADLEKGSPPAATHAAQEPGGGLSWANAIRRFGRVLRLCSRSLACSPVADLRSQMARPIGEVRPHHTSPIPRPLPASSACPPLSARQAYRYIYTLPPAKCPPFAIPSHPLLPPRAGAVIPPTVPRWRCPRLRGTTRPVPDVSHDDPPRPRSRRRVRRHPQ